MMPRKIPALFAYEKLVEYAAKNVEDMKMVSIQRVKQLAPSDLAPIAKLKIFFRSMGAFREFKEELLSSPIDPSYWEDVYNEFPEARRYVRKFYKSPQAPKRRTPLKLKTFMGSPVMSDVSDDDSVLSINSTDDNINFPKPVCQGIRRVCRYYDASRRYKPFEDDQSERDRYRFDLSYN